MPQTGFCAQTSVEATHRLQFFPDVEQEGVQRPLLVGLLAGLDGLQANAAQGVSEQGHELKFCSIWFLVSAPHTR